MPLLKEIEEIIKKFNDLENMNIFDKLIDSDNFKKNKNKNLYINLTKICKNKDKDYKDFIEDHLTKEYISYLSIITKIPIEELCFINNDNDILGHPLLSVYCAQWCSSNFKLITANLTYKYLTGKLKLNESKNFFNLIKEQLVDISKTDSFDEKNINDLNKKKGNNAKLCDSNKLTSSLAECDSNNIQRTDILLRKYYNEEDLKNKKNYKYKKRIYNDIYIINKDQLYCNKCDHRFIKRNIGSHVNSIRHAKKEEDSDIIIQKDTESIQNEDITYNNLKPYKLCGDIVEHIFVTEDKSLYCKKCKCKFSKKYVYNHVKTNKHIKGIKQHYKEICCGIIFLSKTELQRHFKTKNHLERIEYLSTLSTNEHEM